MHLEVNRHTSAFKISVCDLIEGYLAERHRSAFVSGRSQRFCEFYDIALRRIFRRDYRRLAIKQDVYVCVLRGNP